MKQAQQSVGTQQRYKPVFAVAELRERGIPIDEERGDYAPEEQETAIAYIEADTKVEITTGDFGLQRKLEAAGAVPHHVVTFSDSPFTLREYIVPRRAFGITVSRFGHSRKRVAPAPSKPVKQASAASPPPSKRGRQQPQASTPDKSPSKTNGVKGSKTARASGPQTPEPSDSPKKRSSRGALTANVHEGAAEGEKKRGSSAAAPTSGRSPNLAKRPKTAPKDSGPPQGGARVKSAKAAGQIAAPGEAAARPAMPPKRARTAAQASLFGQEPEKSGSGNGANSAPSTRTRKRTSVGGRS